MHIKDVLNKCEELGLHISKSGLYQIGYKKGFIKKVDGKVDFDKDKFFQWVEKHNEKVPDGYLTLNQLHIKLNVSLPYIYLLIKDKDSGVTKVGAKGVMYADPKRIEAIIKKREQSHKENW